MHLRAGAARPLVPHDLESNVHQYIAQTLAPVTLKVYQSRQRWFLYIFTPMQGSSLSHSQINFCACLMPTLPGPLTVKSYLSTIHHSHIIAGHGDPFTPVSFPRLQYVVLRGIKQPQDNPLAPECQAAQDPWATSAAKAMLRAACCMIVWIHEGGRVHTHSSNRLRLSPPLDVSVDSHSNLSLVMVHLKTAPFKQGVDIFLGCTDTKL